MLAPILPALEGDLGISHAQAGGLFFFLSAGYCGSLLASGYMASKVGHKLTAGLASICTSLALLVVAFSEGLWGLRSGVFLLGTAAGLYLPSGIALVASLSPPAHWGRAMAIHEMAPNLALGCSPLLTEVLFMWTSWRGRVHFLVHPLLHHGHPFHLERQGRRPKGSCPHLRRLEKGGGHPRGLWTRGAHLQPGPGGKPRGLFPAYPLPGGCPPVRPGRRQPAAGPFPP